MPSTRQRLHLSRHVRRAAMMAVVVFAAMLPTAVAYASHPEVSLPGSNFEIDTDANLRVDDPPVTGLGERHRDPPGRLAPAARPTNRSARAARRTPQYRRSSTAVSRRTRAT